MGRLGLPNLRLYYFTAQLVYLHWWLFWQMKNAAASAEPAVVSSYEAFGNLIYIRIIHTTQGTVTPKTSLEIYNHCLNILNEATHICSPN